MYCSSCLLCVLGVPQASNIPIHLEMMCAQASVFMPAKTGDGAGEGPRFFVPGAAAASQVAPAVCGHGLQHQV